MDGLFDVILLFVAFDFGVEGKTAIEKRGKRKERDKDDLIIRVILPSTFLRNQSGNTWRWSAGSLGSTDSNPEFVDKRESTIPAAVLRVYEETPYDRYGDDDDEDDDDDDKDDDDDDDEDVRMTFRISPLALSRVQQFIIYISHSRNYTAKKSRRKMLKMTTDLLNYILRERGYFNTRGQIVLTSNELNLRKEKLKHFKDLSFKDDTMAFRFRTEITKEQDINVYHHTYALQFVHTKKLNVLIRARNSRVHEFHYEFLLGAVTRGGCLGVVRCKGTEGLDELGSWGQKG
ncbi:hypothetical protein V1478_007135 [Vespula squamosa]|uniref:Uncharacterized protein n=1 Tax=Vespula squamosa TaxID=30214 RepID=A0ABD2B2A9_VESSQ